MSDDQSVEERFAAETAGINEPSAEPIVSEIFPPGTEPPIEETFGLEQFITEEFVAALLSLPGNIMARRTGRDFWKPSAEEADLLGKGGAPAARYLVRKYLNDSSGPYAALGMVLGAVYAPKIMQEQLEKRKQKQHPPSSERHQNSPTNAASPPSSASEGAASPTNSSGSVEMLDE